MRYFKIKTTNACSAHEYFDKFLKPPNKKMNIFLWKRFTLREDIPYVKGLIVNSNHELTDLISSNPFESSGFILSDKALDIITQFNLIGYRIIPIELNHKNKVVKNYNWITFRDSKLNSANTNHYIDLNESAFKHLDKYNDTYPILNPKLYLEEWKNSTYHLKKRYKNKWDIFYYKNHLFDLVDMQCSAKLKNAIEKNELTGFSFKEMEYDFYESEMEMPDLVISEIIAESEIKRQEKRKEYRESLQEDVFKKLEDLAEDVVFVNENNVLIEKPDNQEYFNTKFIAKGTQQDYFIRIPENFDYNKAKYETIKEAFVNWYFERQNPDDINYSELFVY